VCGLRWPEIDLTGDQAEARKLPKGTPSVTVVNDRVAVEGEICEYTPKGKGRRRAPYLPLPVWVVDASGTTKAKQAAEKLNAGECENCEI
jgi:hypothetical protein